MKQGGRRRGRAPCPTWTNPAAVAKGGAAVIYGEPETSRFLAALQRLKREQRHKEKQTRRAKQRVRAALRKMRQR
jgi:hypothetical protein